MFGIDAKNRTVVIKYLEEKKTQKLGGLETEEDLQELSAEAPSDNAEKSNTDINGEECSTTDTEISTARGSETDDTGSANLARVL